MISIADNELGESIKIGDTAKTACGVVGVVKETSDGIIQYIYDDGSYYVVGLRGRLVLKAVKQES